MLNKTEGTTKQTKKVAYTLYRKTMFSSLNLNEYKSCNLVSFEQPPSSLYMIRTYRQ